MVHDGMESRTHPQAEQGAQKETTTCENISNRGSGITIFESEVQAKAEERVEDGTKAMRVDVDEFVMQVAPRSERTSV